MAIDRSRSRPAAGSNRRGASGAENRGALWPEHSGRSVLGKPGPAAGRTLCGLALSPCRDRRAQPSSGRRTTGSRSVTWISFLALERPGPATDDHVGPSRWRPAVDDWQVHAWRACERRACRPDCRWLGLPVFRSAPSGGRAPQRPRCGAGRGELLAPRPPARTPAARICTRFASLLRFTASAP